MSSTFFCRMPNSGSATFEQVGPTATIGVGAVDAAQDRDAFLRVAAVVEEVDHHLRLRAVGELHAALLVDHVGGREHRRFAVDAERAHHARLGAEAGDPDRLLLRERAAGGERERHCEWQVFFTAILLLR